jgi:hypothetical protein
MDKDKNMALPPQMQANHSMVNGTVSSSSGADVIPVNTMNLTPVKDTQLQSDSVDTETGTTAQPDYKDENSITAMTSGNEDTMETEISTSENVTEIVPNTDDGNDIMPAMQPTDPSMVITSNSIAPLTSFTVFPDLPAELRIKIWRFSFPGPRLVSLRLHDEDDPLKSSCRSSAEIPVALSVCYESRVEAQKQYKLSFARIAGVDEVLEPQIYFDFDRDTLFIPEFNPAAQLIVGLIHKPDRNKVENVAILGPTVPIPGTALPVYQTEDDVHVRLCLRSFEGLKKLSFVANPFFGFIPKKIVSNFSCYFSLLDSDIFGSQLLHFLAQYNKS